MPSLRDDDDNTPPQCIQIHCVNNDDDSIRYTPATSWKYNVDLRGNDGAWHNDVSQSETKGDVMNYIFSGASSISVWGVLNENDPGGEVVFSVGDHSETASATSSNPSVTLIYNSPTFTGDTQTLVIENSGVLLQLDHLEVTPYGTSQVLDGSLSPQVPPSVSSTSSNVETSTSSSNPATSSLSTIITLTVPITVTASPLSSTLDAVSATKTVITLVVSSQTVVSTPPSSTEVVTNTVTSDGSVLILTTTKTSQPSGTYTIVTQASDGTDANVSSHPSTATIAGCAAAAVAFLFLLVVAVVLVCRRRVKRARERVALSRFEPNVFASPSPDPGKATYDADVKGDWSEKHDQQSLYAASTVTTLPAYGYTANEPPLPLLGEEDKYAYDEYFGDSYEGVSSAGHGPVVF
ncbi:uncharacterized protein BXZ73DRAFT_100678 [Epithele typhae]|uniref:uncharacterized protein n=1 Tax=Epithele typhae TaxID=378194 RepID=UPI002007FEBF|nr:uncharacterized protein BXZ73DRAFT_100678 [Epithele typhae]KAH9934487.1 hypothetical protein BXZ73DRAFT_100678 [Epithele typhae]